MGRWLLDVVGIVVASILVNFLYNWFDTIQYNMQVRAAQTRPMPTPTSNIFAYPTYTPRPDPTRTPTPPIAPTPTFVPYRRLDTNDTGYKIMWLQKDQLLEYLEALKERKPGAGKLFADSERVDIKKGTLVRSIEFMLDDKWVHMEILDGPYAGKDGWASWP